MQSTTAAATTTINTLFQLEFKNDAFLALGGIYFVLLVYWIFALRDRLLVSFSTSKSEVFWLIFSATAGLAFGVITTIEWGLPFAGTAFALGLGIGMALLHPTAAACLLASSLFLRPWELVSGDTYLALLPRLSMVLCLGHLTLRYAQKQKIGVQLSKIAKAILIFSGWALLTTLFAPSPSSSQSEFFDGFLKSVVLFFILIQMIDTPESLPVLLGTLLMSFLSVSLISIYQSLYLATLSDTPDFRLVGFGAFKNSNDIAALMVWILPFAAFLSIRKGESVFFRFLGFSLGAAALVAIVLSRSRGAILGVGAIIALYLLIRMGKKALIPLTVLGLILASIATAFVLSRKADDLAGSSAGRKTYFKAGLRMGLKNPLLGVGFNAFPESLQNYSTESLEESKNMTAHNSWILVFAEMGTIGLILFVGIFVHTAFLAWKIYPSSPEYLLALAGYGVTIFFLSHSYLIYPYLLFALIDVAKSFQTPQEKSIC